MSAVKPRVTVYIPCRDYGRFLREAIESVLTQSYDAWELIVIDEASSDGALEIAQEFAGAHPERITLVTHETPRGLQASANEALVAAKGRYIMRLDADDYLDESALLVMANYLDDHPAVALVYPNFIFVDEEGRVLGVESRKRVGDEAKLLDLPAHGACTMVRKKVLKSVGGYDESHDRQDGYDLWLKVVHRHPVANIATPLFSYRQHSSSLSTDEESLLATRAKIYRSSVERNGGVVRPKVVAVVRAKNSYPHMPNIVLQPLAGRPLLDYTLDAALAVDGVDDIIVTTDDAAVVEYTKQHFPDIGAHLRPEGLSAQRVSEAQVLKEAVERLEETGCYPDIAMSLNVHCPLRSAEHIQKAIDTLLLYDVDRAVSVYEDYQLHFVHAGHGLEPLNPAMHQQIRVEREALFAGNGAISVYWREALADDDVPASKVGHLVMPRWGSFQIKTVKDAWLIELILEARKNECALVPERWPNDPARQGSETSE
jgi:CMP-N-acetylneuraminic acid synthetase